MPAAFTIPPQGQHAQPRAWRMLALLLSALALPHSALAQAPLGTSADMQVQAEVVKGCWIDGSGSTATFGNFATLDFGSAPAGSAATRNASSAGTQIISIRCTLNTLMRVRINAGSNSDAVYRNMRLGTSSNLIRYQLCRDANCLQPIPNLDDTTKLLTGADAANFKLEYFARATIPASAPPGHYTDDITVTLTW